MQRQVNTLRPNQKLKEKNRKIRYRSRSNVGKFTPTELVDKDGIQNLVNRLTNRQRKLWAQAGYKPVWLKEFFFAGKKTTTITDAVLSE